MGIEIGYLPTRLTSSDNKARGTLVERAERAGLDHVAVGDHVSFFFGAGFDALLGTASVLASSRTLATPPPAFYRLPYERFEKWSPFETPEQIAYFPKPYIEAGCSLFNLITQGESVEEEIDAAAEIRQLMLEP